MKSFESILRRIQEIPFSESFDAIIAIANGGVIPAGLLNQRLNLEFHVLHINFRDEKNNPKQQGPLLLSEPCFSVHGKKILLVDDRIKSGATVALAKKVLSSAGSVRTFAVNGNADYALFNEDCFKMPWRF